jgi:indoleacetamide hydrolase
MSACNALIEETHAAGDGLRLVVKANIATGTMQCSAATPALAGHRPLAASVVSMLLASGCELVGTANMHELACGVTSNNAAFGAVRNPFDESRVAGGSSGGSAAAVACGVADVALGTDTGGSCRIPAAWCGVVGWRPTTGRYPMDGVVPLCPTRDALGAFARGVDAIAALDMTLTGGDAAPAVGSIRLGVPRTFFWEPLDPDVRSACDRALLRLASAGVELVEVDTGPIGELDEAAGFAIALAEVARELPRAFAAAGVDPDIAVAAIASPDVRALVSHAIAEPIPAAAYRQAIEQDRPALQRAYAAVFARHQLDAIVFPTVPVTAPLIGQDDTVVCDGVEMPLFPTVSRNTSPGSVAGIPGISLPCGVDAQGIGVGIELDGRAGSDRRVLAIAAQLAPIVGAA